MDIQEIIILVGSFLAGYALSRKLAERRWHEREEDYRRRLREARLAIENLQAIVDADHAYQKRITSLPDWQTLFEKIKEV